LKNKQQQTNKPTGAPKPEENEERIVNGKKWYYCSNCMSGRCWNKTHMSEQHKPGLGCNKKKDQDQDASSRLGSHDVGYGQEFLSG
jgi:hypothetical protein